MLVIQHATRLLAQASVDAQPTAIYLRREREGVTYTIAHPGNAAARIRARGVRTEAPLLVLQQRDLTYCVPVAAVVATVSGERTVTDGTDPAAVTYDGDRETTDATAPTGGGR